MNPSLKTDFAQLWVFPQPVKPIVLGSFMYGLNRLRKNSVLYQGTTLVVSP